MSSGASSFPASPEESVTFDESTGRSIADTAATTPFSVPEVDEDPELQLTQQEVQDLIYIMLYGSDTEGDDDDDDDDED